MSTNAPVRRRSSARADARLWFSYSRAQAGGIPNSVHNDTFKFLFNLIFFGFAFQRICSYKNVGMFWPSRRAYQLLRGSLQGELEFERNSIHVDILMATLFYRIVNLMS